MAFRPVVKPPERKPERVMLLDGDIIAYDCAYGVTDDQVENMKIRIDLKINACMDIAGCKDIEVFITGGTNFRDAVAKVQQYKGNRYNPDGSRKIPQPEHLYTARAYLVSKWDANMSTCDEADDQISIRNWQILTGCDLKYDECVIATTDKDIGINPGYYMNLMNDTIERHVGYGHIELTKRRDKIKGWGLKFFLAQLLMGDSTDNIPGLPKLPEWGAVRYGLRRGGMGPVATLGVLDETTEYHEGLIRVAQLYLEYAKQYHPDEKRISWDGQECSARWKDLLIEQGRLLWMRRTPGEMWTPDLRYDHMEKILWKNHDLPIL